MQKRRKPDVSSLKKVNKKTAIAKSVKPNNKKKKLSTKSKVIIALFIVLVLILAIVSGIYLYTKHKLGFMNYKAIDESAIAVNENLYNEIKTDLTKDEFDSVQNFALFGSDSRIISSTESGRSDTIMILSINPKLKSVKLISIPRDTYVEVPGYGMTKINHAYAYGAEELSIKTINKNFGLNLTKYITVDFSGLIDVINMIGGINVTISKEEMEYINSHVYEVAAYSTRQVTKLTTWGQVTLTGEQALMHSRNRTTGGTDFARADRQRQVVNGLIQKASIMSYDKLLSMSDQVLKNIETNITSEEYMMLFTNLFKDKDKYSANVISTQIPSVKYSYDKTIDGIYYFATDYIKAKADFADYLFNK